MSKQSKAFSALIGVAVLVGSALPLAASAADSGEVPFYYEIARTAGHSVAPLPDAQRGRLAGGETPFYYEFAVRQSGTSSAIAPQAVPAGWGATIAGEVPFYYEFSRPTQASKMVASHGGGAKEM
jgi:hypothetical protein